MSKGKKSTEPAPYVRGERIPEPHQRTIRVRPYGSRGEAKIVIGGTVEQGAQIARRFLFCNLPPMDECNGRLFFVTGRFGFVLWIPWVPATIWQLATVTHEAVHAANHTLATAGFEMGLKRDGGPNDEPQAYLADRIFTEVLQFADTVDLRCQKKATATAPKAKGKTARA